MDSCKAHGIGPAAGIFILWALGGGSTNPSTPAPKPPMMAEEEIGEGIGESLKDPGGSLKVLAGPSLPPEGPTGCRAGAGWDPKTRQKAQAGLFHQIWRCGSKSP